MLSENEMKDFTRSEEQNLIDRKKTTKNQTRNLSTSNLQTGFTNQLNLDEIRHASESEIQSEIRTRPKDTIVQIHRSNSKVKQQ